MRHATASLSLIETCISQDHAGPKWQKTNITEVSTQRGVFGAHTSNSWLGSWSCWSSDSVSESAALGLSYKVARWLMLLKAHGHGKPRGRVSSIVPLIKKEQGPPHKLLMDFCWHPTLKNWVTGPDQGLRRAIALFNGGSKDNGVGPSVESINKYYLPEKPFLKLCPELGFSPWHCHSGYVTLEESL